MLHVRLCPCDSPMSEIELKNALAVGKENEIVAFVQPPSLQRPSPRCRLSRVPRKASSDCMMPSLMTWIQPRRGNSHSLVAFFLKCRVQAPAATGNKERSMWRKIS